MLFAELSVVVVAGLVMHVIVNWGGRLFNTVVRAIMATPHPSSLLKHQISAFVRQVYAQSKN